MSALVTVLGTVGVGGSGVVAGVLIAVALSIVPALRAMPVESYISAHKLLGRHWDPTMPVLVLTCVAVEITLACLTPGPALPFVIAAILLAGVSLVSHFCNVPINKQVSAVDPARIPDSWADPRPVWRAWHMFRTVLAILAVFAGGIGAAVQ